MRRSLRTNSLVIVSDHTRGIYDDRWVSNGILHFTGIGLKGDQDIHLAPNKTLAESRTNGVGIFLFEVYEQGKYLFRGRVRLHARPYQTHQPDRHNSLRSVWVFPLRIAATDAVYQVPKNLLLKKYAIKERTARRLSDKALFIRAVHANKRPISRQVAASAFEKNVYVAELAKRRAAGICQLCDQPAPFTAKSGEPYLECHHIVRLAKGGEDTLENTVALCPNCNKKMHILNLKSDVRKLKEAAQKNCCQLTLDGKVVFV
jgi:5-methylcytosine-specific restriction protein A